VAAPDWLDRVAYPFTSRWLDLPSGRLHYIDEGQGRPVVMVHGTPDWSFLWRHLVKALAPRYRCLALDNLGFGLSDRPPGSWYLPEHQAANLKMLIERLGLRDLTLVLHDFGGPFGLHYALDKPDNVHSLVLMNTWMWSLADDRRVARVARLAGSRLGRYLYLEWNLSARLIMKRAFGDPARLPPSVHAQYLAPFPDPASRAATWAYARALWGSREWFDRNVIDRLVNLAGATVRWASHIAGLNDQYVVDGAVNGMADLTQNLGAAVRRPQSGRIRLYVTILMAAVALGLAAAIIVALS